jgi:Ca-activated chloride channel homolog
MRSVPVGLCCLLAIVGLCLGNQQTASIRTDVNLVQLHAKVTDTQGHAVAGLDKKAFHLFVDDVPQEITVFQGEDAPVTAGIVIDNSASMAPKRTEVIAAALAFARASNPKDQMFVVHFNNTVRFGLPKGKRFTGNVSELETAIAAFNLGGTTAFYDALLTAEPEFKFAYYTRKVLLTITDGGDNSSRASLADAITGAREAGIVIYPIGVFDQYDRDRNPDVLKKIAEQTGGSAYFPEHVSDVTATCVRIAQDIREQYTIGFPGADDGQYHRLRLTVEDPAYGKLEVHARAGYIANRPSRPSSQK